MKTSWDDLALFAATARAGALAPAAAATGVSVPTLSRRMKSLEQRLGRRLFHHGVRGYAPTPEGRDLLSRAERMEAAAAEVEAWRARAGGPPRVRISAGTWTARHLAANLPAYWSPAAPWAPEFVHCNLDMDIARREIDVGVRNRRPEQPWLAGRRIGTVRHAPYAAPGAADGWIGATPEISPLPSEAWLAREHGAEVAVVANDPALRLALAEAGIGRAILPTFVGDARPGLRRAGPVIDALTAEQWIVSHHDARHDPPIRAALDAIGDWLAAATGGGADVAARDRAAAGA